MLLLCMIFFVYIVFLDDFYGECKMKDNLKTWIKIREATKHQDYKHIIEAKKMYSLNIVGTIHSWIVVGKNTQQDRYDMY